MQHTKLGLKNAYLENTDFKQWLRQVFCLALVLLNRVFMNNLLSVKVSWSGLKMLLDMKASFPFKC